MLQAQDLLVLFVHFCDTGCYLIKRRSMQGINACIVSLPYADPEGSRIFFFFFFLWGGGGGAGLPENNPDIFLVLNFNILHFTICPHSALSSFANILTRKMEMAALFSCRTYV